MTTHGQRIGELTAGQSAVLEKIPAGGSLEARRLRTGGVAFYWRHTENGRTERTPIGAYDSSAPPKSLKPTSRGYSVQAAIERARELAKENAESPGGLRGKREREEAQQDAQVRAVAARERYTLKALCADYCALLKAREKDSWRDAENIFANHLEAPFPALVAKPAAEVEKREIVEAVRRLTEAGKKTTARKLRAYVRSAYACALRADSDASLPSSFIAYKVTTNPVDGITAIASQADKNPLNAPALRRYWMTLKDTEGVIGAALRLQLLTGGQRAAQLARLASTDIDGDTLRLWDRKGKRTEPREHLLPVTKAMRTELGQLAREGFLLSTDGGKTPMHPTSLSAWAADAGARAKIDGFQLKRVRSGIETLLAQAGISRDIRGQLQSHGIGGVQERHYDAHEYLPEKRKALETLHRLLEQEPAKNVTPIKRKSAA